MGGRELSIKFDRVTLNYGKRNILNELSYTFHKGIYIIQGPSGIGKTSLFNLIASYLYCSSGQVTISSGNNIGYVFQEELLFHNLTVKDNLYIKYCVGVTSGDGFEEELEKMKNKTPIGHLLDEYVKFLSGGEKQWLQLAILSLGQYDIVLLDEPFAKLDDENKEKMLEYINKQWKDQLVLIICHGKINKSEGITQVTLRQGKLYEE